MSKQFGSRHSWQRTLGMSACLLVVGVLAAIGTAVQSSVAQTDALGQTGQVARQLTSPPRDSSPAAPIVVAPVSAPSVQSCVPAAYSRPAALALAVAPDGLSLRIDQPQTYQLYGDTIAEVASQMAGCAPHVMGQAGFAAYTDYALSWQYSSVLASDGSCSVGSAKVGMHIAQIMPAWLPGANTESTVTGTWQSFASGLTTHEHGHVAFDTQYATQLLTDIRQAHASDCGILSELVSAVVNHDVALLAEANDGYDADTNHGASQGALLR